MKASTAMSSPPVVPPSAVPIAHDGRVTANPQRPLAVDAAGAATLCGVSRSMWMKLLAQDAVPPPVKLGRRALWHVGTLDRWLAAGCPPVAKWLRMQQETLA